MSGARSGTRDRVKETEKEGERERASGGEKLHEQGIDG